MSQNEPISVRLHIEPEPSAAELVAILQALRRQTESQTQEEQPTRSRWAEAARRDQLRAPLNERRDGWSR